jgi:hypothetical protein
VDALNVSQVLAAYNASLTDVLERKASPVTGTLKPKNDKVYRGGELFRVLEDGSARLTVRTPARYRDLSGRRVTVPAAVAAALSVQKVDTDLVAIVRGGGEGISALSDPQVIDAVAHDVHIPIVSPDATIE